ncbi:NUDIX domain-containing protein [Nocardioides sp. DS6]|uniref:NUDIX domain-containing protein n=1 Tax=Nocardioides eburneus TaxID=3231482 RepID=A0ABV3SUZ0_9ACTN
MPTNPRARVQAAGAVVFRPGREVLLVHRPKYDDWSFPKGKLDRGEPTTVAAVREVEEETGLQVRLGRPLRGQRYPVRGGEKVVHYWAARVADGASDDVASYPVNDEIDRVAWVPVDEAATRLTYPRDRDTLAEAVKVRKATVPFVVLRHGEARARSGWRGDDRLRPLLVAGRRQAVTAAGILAAYDVARVVTSPSTRCMQTVAPYAGDADVPVEELAALSEEEAEKGAVAALSGDLLGALPDRGPTVVCTHRPVLPWIFEALGVHDPRLEKGELMVLHVRHGAVVATERHLPH